MGKDRDDEETLLPTSSGRRGSSAAPQASFAFKCYVIASMTVLWTGYTISVRYTRSTTIPEDLYASTTVVLCAEFIKTVITLAMIFREGNLSVSKFGTTLQKHYFGQPWELAKMSVPSVVYALQNNLDFVALSNLDAGVYQVTTQLKVVTTALFMMAFLGRKFSGKRWVAIFLLFVGVAFVQLDTIQQKSVVKAGNVENYFVGIIAVLSTCFTAGFAGVYYEKMLKDGGSTPFWIRNLQMYSCGVIVTALGCLNEHGAIREKGFFYGYDEKVFIIVGLLSVGGIYISLVMKHLDNLYKSFASAVSVIFVVILSLFVFEGVYIGAYFVLGTAMVCFAILMYNSVPE
ncbi:unnamed protein product, partial [Mesorhabditis spiculigera]